METLTLKQRIYTKVLSLLRQLVQALLRKDSNNQQNTSPEEKVSPKVSTSSKKVIYEKTDPIEKILEKIPLEERMHTAFSHKVYTHEEIMLLWGIIWYQNVGESALKEIENGTLTKSSVHCYLRHIPIRGVTGDFPRQLYDATDKYIKALYDYSIKMGFIDADTSFDAFTEKDKVKIIDGEYVKIYTLPLH